MPAYRRECTEYIHTEIKLPTVSAGIAVSRETHTGIIQILWNIVIIIGTCVNRQINNEKKNPLAHTSITRNRRQYDILFF